MAKQIENILGEGMNTKESIDILFSLTSMQSEQMRKAITFHFVNGGSIDTCCMMFSVTQSNFTRNVKKLNDVARKIDQYFEINYKK